MINEWLLEELSVQYMVPVSTCEALYRYVNDGIPTGDFLYCVLTNDLFGATARADIYNLPALGNICKLIYNELPAASFGNEEKVASWRELKAEDAARSFGGES